MSPEDEKLWIRVMTEGDVQDRWYWEWCLGFVLQEVDDEPIQTAVMRRSSDRVKRGRGRRSASTHSIVRGKHSTFTSTRSLHTLEIGPYRPSSEPKGEGNVHGRFPPYSQCASFSGYTGDSGAGRFAPTVDDGGRR